MRWTLATTRTRSLMVNCGTLRVKRDADVDRVPPFAVVVVGALQGGVAALPLARRRYRLDLLYPDRQALVMTAAVQVTKLGPRLVLMCRPVLRCSRLLVGTLQRRVAHLLHARASCFPSCILPRTTQRTTLLHQNCSTRLTLTRMQSVSLAVLTIEDLLIPLMLQRRGVDSGLLTSCQRTALLPQMPSGTTGVAKPMTFQAWVFASPATANFLSRCGYPV
jgi:hypothetical protein